MQSLLDGNNRPSDVSLHSSKSSTLQQDVRVERLRCAGASTSPPTRNRLIY